VGGQAEGGEHLGGTRALHGDHAVVAVLICDRDVGRRDGGEGGHHGGRVRGIRDQQHLVLGHQVCDEVVDHATGVIAAQRVLGLADGDPAEVGGEAPVDELGG